jgi:hypothetical protein
LHKEGCPQNYTSCPGNAFGMMKDSLIDQSQKLFEECIGGVSEGVDIYNKISIYPNPFTDVLKLHNIIIKSQDEIKVVNPFGCSVPFKYFIDNNFTMLQLNVGSGFYIIKYNGNSYGIIKY